jgi:hypothetical protein
MGKTPSVYFDNSILRDLTDYPRYWNDLEKILLPLHGQSLQPRSSYYLFFEYFPLKSLGLKIPSNNLCKFSAIHDKERACAKIEEIDKNLNDYFDYGQSYYLQQLLLKENEWHDLIKKREKDESPFEGSKELRTILFQGILDLLYSDYAAFSEQAAFYLAWNWFCNIQPAKITREILRERQLGIWNQLRENDFLLPFGKIIDDFAEKNITINLVKNSHLGGNLSDMVDAEGITLALMEKTIFFTYDEKINIEQRIKLGLQTIIEIEYALKINIPKNFGKVYYFSRPNKKSKTPLELVEIYEPSSLIAL